MRLGHQSEHANRSFVDLDALMAFPAAAHATGA
jgi:hypothetical protein